MPKTSIVERKKGYATTYKKIREVNAAKVRNEMSARGMTRNALWKIRREAKLYGLFAGDPFRRAFRGGDSRRHMRRKTRKN